MFEMSKRLFYLWAYENIAGAPGDRVRSSRSESTETYGYDGHRQRFGALSLYSIDIWVIPSKQGNHR